MKLEKYINDRLKQPTVILCIKILLENHLKNGFSSAMTKTQVESLFNPQCYEFGISTFRRDYLLRQVGNSKNGITQSNDMFYIKRDWLDEAGTLGIENSLEVIRNKYAGRLELQKKILRLIERAKDSRSFESKMRVINYFLNEFDESKLIEEKRGQGFEVTGFSILYGYFQNFGFELNRYSTVYSNDGGVDYSAQHCIYQVTTKMSKKKFEEDLSKSPFTKRVMVYKNLVSGFHKSDMKHDWVLDTIDLQDIKDKLEYIVNRGERHINVVIEKMLKEFEREFYM